ncbi:MAG: M16 family metallopeptidase [Rhodanobacter sp.]
MNRPTGILLLAVFTSLCSVAAAEPPATFPSTPPAPGPAPVLTLPTPTAQTLPNGLRVISVRRDGLPLVTAQLVIRSGDEMDPPQLAGLAELTARVLTKGAAGLTAPQIADAAEALGGSLEASAGWDESDVGITVTTPRLPQALALLAKVVRQPEFSARELKRAQAQAIDDVHLSLSRPATLAARVAARGIFGTGAYGHPRGGTPASIERIARADVQQWHERLYRPDNAILILAGDVTPAQALQLAQASFGDWVRPSSPLPAKPPGSGDRALAPVVLINQHGAGQAGVVAAHAVPPRSDAHYFAGLVADAVLGGSYSARLNEEIRIKRGLSYGAFSNLQPLGDAGLWLASAQTRNPAVPQVIDLMLAQFRQLGDEAVPPAELAARKATLIGSYGRSLETTAGLAEQVAALAIYDVPLDELGRYAEQVNAVTPRQLRKYAHKHLDADAGTVVVVGDASQFAAAVRKAHPKAVLLDAASLDLERADLGTAAH